MPAPRPLKPNDLRWSLEPSAISRALKNVAKDARPGALGQERAMRALDVGLGIRERGFNIFVSGALGTGRTSTVRHLLSERARAGHRPDDWALIYNFEDADRPRAVRLKPGTVHDLKKDVDKSLARLLQELQRAFEAEGYRGRRQRLLDKHTTRTERRLTQVEREALKRSFALQRTPTGLTIGPARNGEPMTEEEYNTLPRAERARLERQSAAVEELLDEAVRAIRGFERDLDAELADLDKEEVRRVGAPIFTDLADRWRANARLKAHFERALLDLVEHTSDIRPPDEAAEGPGAANESAAQPESHREQRTSPLSPEALKDENESYFTRFRINALVDNRSQKGAPVIEETHPTAFNLLGRIEHRIRGGEAVTDFTRIKAGALHRANGGYLLVDAIELFREPAAWEGLKRALKNRALEIEDAGEPGRMVSIASLRPEPIPLEVKVLIVGTPELYYLLSKGDPDFQKLFKVKAEFDVEMDRTADRLKRFASFLVAVTHEEKLRPFDASGLARTLEYAARVASDRRKLTTRFGEIADLVREASFWASRRRSRRITAVDVREALDARRDRERVTEDRLREAIRDGSIRIDVAGAVTGQINGLTVMELGNYAFGAPARISARVFAGRGGVLDLEREVEMGGPIHTKGVLILHGLLGHLFGRHRPITMAATLCMEQSYSEVEGDSASLAEALCLISALSGYPLKQNLAVTGSIDQFGNVQPVGGVNEKIEGFFDTCRVKQLTGDQGVAMPETNVSELMLRDDVVEAVRRGQFQVVALRTLDEAVELFTGRPLGEADARGRFPTGSVGAACMDALDRLQASWNRSVRTHQDDELDTHTPHADNRRSNEALAKPRPRRRTQ